MKNYQAQTLQNLALAKILQNFRKTSTTLESFESKRNTNLWTCFNCGLLRFKLKQFPYVVNLSFSKFTSLLLLVLPCCLNLRITLEKVISLFFFLFQSLYRICQLSQVLKIPAVPKETTCGLLPWLPVAHYYW